MNKVLIGLHSFGEYYFTGKEILENRGFAVKRISPESRPLKEARLMQIFVQERSQDYSCGIKPLSEKVLLVTQDLKMIVRHSVETDNVNINNNHLPWCSFSQYTGANTNIIVDFAIVAMFTLLYNLCQTIYFTKDVEWRRFLDNEFASITADLVDTELQGFKKGNYIDFPVPNKDSVHNLGAFRELILYMQRRTDIHTKEN